MNGLRKLVGDKSRIKQLVLYGIFGVLTTVVNMLSYNVSYSLLGIPNVPSTIIAWVLAVAFAFITNKLWVFSSKSFDGKTLRHEILSFLGARIGTGLIDLLIMYVAVDVLKWNPILWKLISNVIVIILNYIASRLVIFRKPERGGQL